MLALTSASGFGCGADREIEDGDMVLLDMGTEYYRYGSDITVTLPANGKFSDKQRGIYEVHKRLLASWDAWPFTAGSLEWRSGVPVKQLTAM